jgi:voltage-gated potassium channel Kch
LDGFDRSTSKFAKRLAVSLPSLVVVVGPVALARGGWYLVIWTLLTALPFTMFAAAFRSSSYFFTLLMGILIGFTVLFLDSRDLPIVIPHIFMVVEGFLFAAIWAVNLEEPRSFMSATMALIIAGVMLIFQLSLYWATQSQIKNLAFPAMMLGIAVGTQWGKHLRPLLWVFEDIFIYLRKMGVYLVGFAVGYLSIAFLFGAWYWSIWKLRGQTSFAGLPGNANFGDFIYFSIVTISTLGYGDVAPASKTTKALVCLEVITGVGWMTVVFATVLARLQPRFDAIVKQSRNKDT